MDKIGIIRRKKTRKRIDKIFTSEDSNAMTEGDYARTKQPQQAMPGTTHATYHSTSLAAPLPLHTAYIILTEYHCMGLLDILRSAGLCLCHLISSCPVVPEKANIKQA